MNDEYANGAPPRKGVGFEAYYALIVLASVAVFNVADRSIMSVLAQAIRADLRISDSQLAFLYGTAFVTLYTLLGLPMAMLADRASRQKMLAAGLVAWSFCTAMGGFAMSFATLALTRFGVGVGEASANPVSQSLLADLFPQRQRAKVFAVYLAGVFFGAGLAAVAGGKILDSWPHYCGQLSMCSVRPWQAAFLAVALPGFPLALFVLRIREPVRGALEGQPIVPVRAGRWRVVGRAMLSVLPFISILAALRRDGRRAAWLNVKATALLLAIALALAWITGDYLQWLTVFVGANAIVSWILHLAVMDPVFVRLTIGTPAFLWSTVGFSLLSGIVGAVQFWTIPYAVREFGISAGAAGAMIGPILALGSFVGVMGGGVIADAWHSRDPRGYLYFSIVSAVLTAVSLVGMLLAPTIGLYIVLNIVTTVVSTAWSGVAGAQAQDFVVPRMRAVTSAISAMIITQVNLAFGPHIAGRIGEATGSLALGLAATVLLAPLAVVFFLVASRTAIQARATKFERAGESSAA